MTGSRDRSKRQAEATRRCGALTLLILGTCAVAWYVWPPRETRKPTAGRDSRAGAARGVAKTDSGIPFPVSSSPFLNTRVDVKYVGSAACRECHEAHEATFLHTGMGRSMAEVDLDREPPDATYDHLKSKRRYQVVRRDGQLWHRELLIRDGADEVLLAEYPMKYVVGSGRHSLTYVFEDQGFLMESPLTWYASRKAWEMSPGYDRPEHSSFEREVSESCLVCHAGRVESIDRSLHRLRVVEPTIGCEQCHGPGELHRQRHSKSPRDEIRRRDAIDYTIVNPAHLSRELALSVCEQCHLKGEARIPRRGRSLRDFRPGLPLDDFWQVYRLEPPDENMTVVGHVEQMLLSKCYTQSPEYSCLTCHSPHSADPPRGQPEHFNRICQTCHAPDKCRETREERNTTSPADHCIHCHMPTSETDIPHLAFTHHRVAVHASPKAPRASVGEAALATKVRQTADTGQRLAPLREAAPQNRIEPLRSAGLAYIEAAIDDDNLARRTRFQRTALQLLSEYRGTVERDGMVDAWLARLRADANLGGVEPLAASALDDPTLAGIDRTNALFLLAESQFARGGYQDALGTLSQLHALRRHSLQWLLQAQCEKNLGHDAGVERALREAVRINPRLVDIQRFLAKYYRDHGDERRAEYHSARAVP